MVEDFDPHRGYWRSNGRCHSLCVYLQFQSHLVADVGDTAWRTGGVEPYDVETAHSGTGGVWIPSGYAGGDSDGADVVHNS